MYVAAANEQKNKRNLMPGHVENTRRKQKTRQCNLKPVLTNKQTRMNEKSGRSVGQQAAQAKPEMIGSLKSGRINGQPRMSVAQGRGRAKVPWRPR